MQTTLKPRSRSTLRVLEKPVTVERIACIPCGMAGRDTGCPSRPTNHSVPRAVCPGRADSAQRGGFCAPVCLNCGGLCFPKFSLILSHFRGSPELFALSQHFSFTYSLPVSYHFKEGYIPEYSIKQYVVTCVRLCIRAGRELSLFHDFAVGWPVVTGVCAVWRGREVLGSVGRFPWSPTLAPGRGRGSVHL